MATAAMADGEGGWPEGTWVNHEDPRWPEYIPMDGTILELEVERGDAGATAVAALVVSEFTPADDAGWLIRGRYLGASSTELAKELTQKISRRRRPVHLCRALPCSQEGELLDYVHATNARWWHPVGFQGWYLRSWAQAVLKELVAGPGAEKDGGGAKEDTKKKKKPPREDKGGKAPKDGEAAAKAKAAAPKKGDGTGLRKRLSALRAKLARHGGEPAKPDHKEIADVSDNEAPGEEWEEDESGSWERVGGLTAGDRLRDPEPPTTMLAIADGVVDDVKVEPGVAKKKVGKRKKKRIGVKKDAGSQLLVMAEQRKKAEDERKAKKRKRASSSTSGKVKLLLKALLGENDAEKKKKKRRKGLSWRKKGQSSPSPSDSEEGSEEEKSTSDDEELVAPLTRRSQKKPGAVLQMLLNHARQVMDQSSGLTMASGSAVTHGVKLASYFNMMVRPYHASTSRDMKEMHLLAVAIDELRAGDLGRLGDSLASRFVAIHTAVNEGNWKSAQFLEMHPLEAPLGAPSAVLLEAQKHGRLVNKSRGLDEYPRFRGTDTRPKGYGKASEWKDKGKGKGRGDGKGKSQPLRKGDPNGPWWNNKDTKGAKDDKGKTPPKEGDV